MKYERCVFKLSLCCFPFSVFTTGLAFGDERLQQVSNFVEASDSADHRTFPDLLEDELVGLIGPTENIGPTGQRGPTENRGPTGRRGPTANIGPTGQRGPTGNVGPTGRRGS